MRFFQTVALAPSSSSLIDPSNRAPSWAMKVRIAVASDSASMTTNSGWTSTTRVPLAVVREVRSSRTRIHRHITALARGAGHARCNDVLGGGKQPRGKAVLLRGSDAKKRFKPPFIGKRATLDKLDAPKLVDQERSSRGEAELGKVRAVLLCDGTTWLEIGE
jgi:hypothetical protein